MNYSISTHHADVFGRAAVVLTVLVSLAVGIAVGVAVRVSATPADIEHGTLDGTGGPLDFVVEGDGYFQVQDPSGDFLYTRAGNFRVNRNQQLVIGSGHGLLVEPSITFPVQTVAVIVTESGLVKVRTSDSPDLALVGQLQLGRFRNPDGLIPRGDGLYQESAASGLAQTGEPGRSGFGTIRHRTVEASYVIPAQEMMASVARNRRR